MRLNAARNKRHIKAVGRAVTLAAFLALVLLLLLSASFSFLFFPPQCTTWPAWPRLGSVVQFHTCLLCWHLSEHIFPPSTFPLTLFCISSTLICRVSSPLCEGGTSGRRGPPCRPYFKVCHGVQFGNRSELEEKESSKPHKHLDNCLLQHEKQLEVSGS